VALDAEGAEDDAERQVERLEHRALLDVELEVRGRALELPPRVERPLEVDAVGGERLRECHAVRVRAPAEVLLVVHRPGGGARPEEAPGEAGALLVGPVHEPDREGRAAFLGDAAQHLDAGEEVERPVEPAAVRDGVDVAADEERALGLAP
jgi:hypothetical protein